ncbi:MAG: hydroxymethylglutaryl-CoA reductase, degradative [Candidatus Micrarchaeota archaeon]
METSGFYKLSTEERMERIKKHAKLTDEEVKIITNGGSLSAERADKMIENVFGAIHLPMGVATNFKVNGKEYVVPMAIEEASVIAAASRAAKQTLPDGFKASADSPIMVGQILLTNIEDIEQAMKNLDINKKKILEIGGSFLKHVEIYGCGLKDFKAKTLDTDRGKMIVVNFFINVGDAQGANMVNSTLEGVAPSLEKIVNGTARLKIVSNLATERLANATAVWKKEVVGEQVIEAVLDGYEFAKTDIYRCSTHNKGIMNGIDAVAIAVGNDWRSVEAGAHTYAAMGKYEPLTKYYKNENGDLVGSIDIPLALATAGPAMSSNPTATIALKILGTHGSKELAMVIACVGLANNFAALSALGTVGIQSGHMKLHARSIASQAGAVGEEVDKVAGVIAKEKNFQIEYAQEVLERVRK